MDRSSSWREELKIVFNVISVLYEKKYIIITRFWFKIKKIYDDWCMISMIHFSAYFVRNFKFDAKGTFWKMAWIQN